MALKIVPETEKTAVVTGAGRGLGRALVEELNKRGYKVIALVRNLADEAALFTQSPTTIFPLRCDVSEASTEAVLRQFLERQVSGLDLLINNAGFGANGFGIEGLKMDELDRVLAVSLHGPIRCVRSALPFLRLKRGTVVNITSRFASLKWVSENLVPNDQATYAYRIAKAAQNMLSSCLAAEFAGELRIMAVDPGKLKTRFGPKDADTNPEDAARAIIDLAETGTTGPVFVNASGEQLPW